MSQPTLPPMTTSTVSMFSLTDALGVDGNALVDALARLESQPELSLKKVAELRRIADVIEASAVQRLRAADRWGRRRRSWAWIGDALGMSRQAAQKRHPEVD